MRYVLCILNSYSIEWIKSFDNFDDAIIATNIWISRLNINGLLSTQVKDLVENGGFYIYLDADPKIFVTVEDD